MSYVNSVSGIKSISNSSQINPQTPFSAEKAKKTQTVFDEKLKKIDPPSTSRDSDSKSSMNYKQIPFYDRNLIEAALEKNSKKVKEIYHEILEKFTPNNFIYFSIIRALIYTGLVLEAKQLIDKLKSSGIKSDSNVYSMLIHMLVQQGKSEEAAALRQEMDAMGESVPSKGSLEDLEIFLSNKAINHAGQSKDLKKAQAIFNQMKAKELKLDIHSYTSLMHVFCEAKQFVDVKRIFDEMHSDKIEINVVPYNILMKSYIKQKNLSEAVKVWKEMQSKGLQEDEITRKYAEEVLNTYLRLNKQQEALALRQEMEARGYFDHPSSDTKQDLAAQQTFTNIILDGPSQKSQPTAEQYKLKEQVSSQQKTKHVYQCLTSDKISLYDRKLMNAAVKKDSSTVKTLYQEILRRYKPNVTIYASLIRAFIYTGLALEAKQLFDKMNEAGFPPDFEAYSWLLDLFIQQDNLQEAEDLRQQMKTKKKKEVVDLGAVIYAKTIHYAAQDRDPGQAQKLLNWMIAKKINPSAYIYSSLMQAYLVAKQFSKVKETFEHMRSQGIQPSLVNYQILLSSLIEQEDLQTALAVWKEMQAKDLEFNEATSKILIDLYMHLENFQEGKTLLQEMQKHQILNSNTSAFDLALISHARAIDKAIKDHDIKKVKETFNEFIKKGFTPNTDLYNLLMQAYFTVQQFLEVENVFNQMSKEGIKPSVQTYSCLLATFTKQKKLDDVLKIWGEMQSKGLSPDIYCYNSLLGSLSFAKQFSKVKEVFDQMCLEGIKPSRGTYKMLLDFFVQQENPQEGLAVWNAIRAKGIQADHSILNKLASLYIERGDFTDAERFFEWKNYQFHLRTGKVEGKEVLDCHGLLPSEACMLIFLYLKTKGSEIEPFLVITGVGHHSASNEIFQIQTQVLSFIEKFYPSIRCRLQEDNLGVVEMGGFLAAQSNSKPAKLIPAAMDSYTSLMKSFCKNKQFGKVEAVFDQMKLAGGKPSLDAYKMLFESLVKQHKREKISALLQEMQHSKVSKQEIKIMLLKQILANRHKAAAPTEKSASAHSYPESESLLGVNHFNDFYNKDLLSAALEKKSEKVKALYQEFLQKFKLTPFICSSMVQILIHTGLAWEAKQIIDKMNAVGITPTLEVYGWLLELFNQQGLSQEANVLRQEMKEKGYSSPMPVSLAGIEILLYNRAIHRAVKNKNFKQAEAFFNQIKSKGLNPDTYSYAALMSAFFQASQFSDVKRIFDQMQSEGIEPNILSYNSLLASFIKEEKLGETLTLLSEIQNKKIQPDKRTAVMANQLVQLCIKQKDFISAIKCWQQMVEQSIEIRKDNFSELFSILLNSKNIKDLLELLYQRYNICEE